jgi:hypothetical protein
MLTSHSISCGVNLAYTTEISTPLSASFLGTQTCTKHREMPRCFRSGVLPITTTTNQHTDTQTTSALPLISSAITRNVYHHYPLHTCATVVLARTTRRPRHVGFPHSISSQIALPAETGLIRRKSYLKFTVIALYIPLVCPQSRQYMIIFLCCASSGGCFVSSWDVPVDQVTMPLEKRKRISK